MQKRKHVSIEFDSTESESMQRLIKCKICNQTYESPIILPCFKTVCSKHVFNDIIISKYSCQLCNQEHDTLADQFPSNEDIAQLIKITERNTTISAITFGNECSRAKKLCKELETHLNEADLLSKDPSFYVFEYYDKLKNEIDLNKERRLKEIEEQHEKLIDHLKSIEIKCMTLTEKELFKSNESIENTRVKLNDWNERIKSSTDSNWTVLIPEMSCHLRKTKYLVERCKNELKSHKEYEFVPNKTSEDIGQILTKEIDIIDEKRPVGIIRFVIDNFSEFKYSKETIESKEHHVVNKIPWIIEAKMEETENFERYLSVFARVDSEFKKVSIRRPNVYIRIIYNSGKSAFKNICSSAYGFDADKNRFGQNKFISLKDILNPTNRIYNKENDSITIEAQIELDNSDDLEFCNQIVLDDSDNSDTAELDRLLCF